jgi:hypothetical protein
MRLSVYLAQTVKVRPGDRGYYRAALDACVDDLESAPVPLTVELTWTLADGFCVVYTTSGRSTRTPEHDG